jgi:uncharacterized repeat protein (TIGR01451 family)
MAGSLRFNARRGAAALLALVLVMSAFVVMAPAAQAADVLTIDKSAPSVIAPGQRLTYTIVMTNTGGSKVTEVAMTDVVQGLEGFDGTERLDLTSSSSSGSSGSCGQSGNTVTCNKGTMKGFETWTVTISGLVIAADGTTLNNTAFVVGTKSAQQHQASDTTQTRVDLRAGESLPDLNVSIKGPNTIEPSHDILYTVTVNNLGEAKASDVALTVTMPNTVTFLMADATSLFSCALDPPQAETTTLSCTGGAVNAGANATVQVGVQAPDPVTAPLTVTAAVDPFDAIFELDEGNNFAQATTADSATAPPEDLHLEKTDASDPIAPGETLVYTLTLENKSAYRADYIEVVDGTQGLEAASVTAGAQMFNVASNTPPMTCAVNAPLVSCTTTRFPPGGISVITITGRVIAQPGSTILNTATVNGNIKNTGVTNTASTITTVKPSIDLTVTQHRTLPELPTPVRAADRFDYTITVGNSGLYDANNVIVRQPLPAGSDTTTTKDDVVFDGFAASDGGTACSVDPLTNVLTCTIPKVRGANSSGQPQGTTETITLLLIAPHRIGQITSTVTVDPANIIPENFEDNNTYTTTTDVLTGIDLTVSKTDTPDPVARNGTLRYTITVPNLGTQDAEAIVVRDVLPTGTVFRTASDVSLHNFTCAPSGNVVECVGGRIRGTYSGSLTLPVDAATIEIDVFAPDEPGVYHNEVRVDPYGTIPEKDETNNLFLENTTVENTHTGAGMYKELYIDKLDEVSPDLPPYATNGLLDYDLVVANAGQSAVGAPDNLVVRITLPQGSRFRAAYDGAGAADGAFTCTYPGTGLVVECFGGTVESLGTRAIRIETFAPNDQGEALIQAIVDPDNRVLEADETNNTADERTVIQAGEAPTVQGTYIDLKVHEIVDSPDPVGTNSTLDYDISIKNLGVADAFGVKFTAALPAGATFRDATDLGPTEPAFSCTESGGVVTCGGARIDGGAARVVKVRVFAPGTPSSSTVQHQLRVVVDPDNTIPEGHEGNNARNEITTVQIDGPGGFIDLKVTGTPTIRNTDTTTAGEVIPGGRITYEMTITNDGTDDAINVAFRDWLPAGMKFVSAISDSLDGNFFTCGQANGVIDCAGGYVKGTDSNGGTPGTRKVTIVADAPLAADLQVVNQAAADPDNAIPEQSEINNATQVPNQVKSIVDLNVTITETQHPGAPGQEGKLKFTATDLIAEANSRAGNIVFVANLSPGSTAIDVATTNRTDWTCQVFENPVNQVRCVGNFSQAQPSVEVEVHYFRTSNDAIHSFGEIDPEEDTTDVIVGRSVETNEDNNKATSQVS